MMAKVRRRATSRSSSPCKEADAGSDTGTILYREVLGSGFQFQVRPHSRFKQGDPNTRKYLSEPPVQYRVASDTAPQNELGEDEYKKERRLKKEAEGKKGSGWFDWLPSL